MAAVNDVDERAPEASAGPIAGPDRVRPDDPARLWPVRRGAWAVRPKQPDKPPPLDPAEPIPDDPGPLMPDSPDDLPPAPIEPSPDTSPAEPEPEPV